MNVFDKIFSKLYRYDENMKSHIPAKWVVIVAAFITIMLIIGVKINDKKAEKVNYLEYHETLDTTYVVHPAGGRGWLTYDHYEYAVNSKSELVENKQSYDDWNFYRKTNPSSHSLSHLPGPYYMYKAANNDTIVVIKDGYVLKFKMPQPDTVSRRMRLLRD